MRDHSSAGDALRDVQILCVSIVDFADQKLLLLRSVHFLNIPVRRRILF